MPGLMMVAAVASLATCKVENAVYAQRTAPGLTARFVAADTGPFWPSGLALRMHVEATDRTYWWLPWNGGSGGQNHLASTSDVTAPDWAAPGPDDAGQRPLGDVRYIGVDASYRLLPAVPRRGEVAPAHFLIPDLREALWYRTPPDARDSEAGQFFDLVACRAAP